MCNILFVPSQDAGNPREVKELAKSQHVRKAKSVLHEISASISSETRRKWQ
jgi:hypothetical protein